jgi:hypothetical protein
LILDTELRQLERATAAYENYLQSCSVCAFQPEAEAELSAAAGRRTELEEETASLRAVAERRALPARVIDLAGQALSARELDAIITGELAEVRVTFLNLRGCGLDRLPDSIGTLVDLQALDISDNHLRRLPESIGRLVELRELDASGNNRLRQLPDSFSDLQNLRSLNLSDNSFRTFPSPTLELGTLDYLDFSCNELRVLPEDVGELSRLSGLGLRGNYLNEVPDAFLDLTVREGDAQRRSRHRSRSQDLDASDAQRRSRDRSRSQDLDASDLFKSGVGTSGHSGAYGDNVLQGQQLGTEPLLLSQLFEEYDFQAVWVYGLELSGNPLTPEALVHIQLRTAYELHSGTTTCVSGGRLDLRGSY